MEEEDTNPELTNFLNKPLETKKRTVDKLYEDEVEESEEDPLAEPITAETKNRILLMAANLTQTDPKTYLPLLEKLRKMTEGEAQLYLQCLEASVNQEAWVGVTNLMLETVADVLIHPDDGDTKKQLINDPIIKKLASQECGSILLSAGKIGLLFLVGFYGLSSWSRRKFQLYSKSSKPASDPSFPDDSRRAKPVGKDDSNGQVVPGEVDDSVQ